MICIHLIITHGRKPMDNLCEALVAVASEGHLMARMHAILPEGKRSVSLPRGELRWHRDGRAKMQHP